MGRRGVGCLAALCVLNRFGVLAVLVPLAIALIFQLAEAADGKLGPTGRRLKAMGNEVPMPTQRPQGENAAKPASSGDDASAPPPESNPESANEGAKEAPTVRPTPKPAEQPTPVPKDAENKKTGEPVQQGQKPQDGAEQAASQDCIKALALLADAEPVDAPKASDPNCRIGNPVQLTAIKGDFPIRLAGKPVLECSFALALADFLANTAQPLARHHAATPLTGITTGPGFVCRRRNNAKTGKLSEHAFGNAIDITVFQFGEKQSLSVGLENGKDRWQKAFFDAFRKSACGWFTTVLGPGSNAAHGSHFHFDLGRNSKTNAYRICE